MLKYLTILLPILFSFNLEAKTTSEKHCDIPGGNLKSIKSTTLENCLKECDKEAKCKGFTFISGWNRCFLKKKVSRQVNLRMFSGYLLQGQQDSFQILHDTDFKGHDLRSVPNITSTDNCVKACSEEPKCRGFAYLDGYKTCWLKDRISKKPISKIFHCGVKEEK